MRKTTKRLLVLAALLVPAVAAGASLLSPRGRIEQSLASLERLPSAERLDQLSENQSFTWLRTIVEDKSSPPKVRLSALTALATYPGAETEVFLRRTLEDFARAERGLPTLYARAAMRSLARLSGPASARDLVPWLTHASPDLRAEAAECLVVADARQALPALRDALAVEVSPVVKQAIDDAIVSLTVRSAP